MVEAVGIQGGGSPVGERLRAAREAKSIALEDVASQTRIPIRHLEHIERGEWDALPAATYSVGFARSYATVVGLDPAEVGGELRQELGIARNPNHSSPAAAYYEPADPARVPPRSIALIAAVLIVLLVAGYLLWRNQAVGDAPAEPQLVETQAPVGQPQAQPAQQAQAATGPVVIAAAEDAWLRVYEAGGRPVLREGILKAGERYEVPSTAVAPQLRTSRPQALRITVGATQIAQLGPAEQLVADVSLKAPDLVARSQGQPAAPAAPGATAPIVTGATPED